MICSPILPQQPNFCWANEVQVKKTTFWPTRYKQKHHLPDFRSSLKDLIVTGFLFYVPSSTLLPGMQIRSFKNDEEWGTHVYLWRIHFEIWQN